MALNFSTSLLENAVLFSASYDLSSFGQTYHHWHPRIGSESTLHLGKLPSNTPCIPNLDSIYITIIHYSNKVWRCFNICFIRYILPTKADTPFKVTWNRQETVNGGCHWCPSVRNSGQSSVWKTTHARYNSWRHHCSIHLLFFVWLAPYVSIYVWFMSHMSHMRSYDSYA